MQVIDDLTTANLQQDTIVTIGAFDGVHRGHQALIGAVVQQAQAADRLAALITFHPHPAVVLAPKRAPKYLTTPGEKVALLEGLGLDLVVLLPFDRQVAATPARDFIEMLVEYLRLRALWIGADFALGRNRQGDVDFLRELGQELGYQVHAMKPLLSGEEAISSSRIRTLLREGRVQEATRLLGRPPSLSGEVVYGLRRGRTLGFPTANLEVRPERATPADGVYAVLALLGDECRPAVANIGLRPSFDDPRGGQRTIEVHIFDFDQDIYGCDLLVEFVARLRDERRFEKIDDLIAQIERDSLAARRILDNTQHLIIEGDATRNTPPARRYRYQEIDHTADRALHVWGQSLPDLFAGAARGLYSLMADLDGLAATRWQKVRLEAPDRETLLVDWLNELLFFTEMEGLLFVDSRLEMRQEEEQMVLKAQVGGLVAPVTKAHIKAATFHNLEIAPDESGWSTLITFDV